MKKTGLMVLSLAALTLLGSCGGQTPTSSSSSNGGNTTSSVEGSSTAAATITSVSIEGGKTVELGSTLKLSAKIEGTGDFSKLVNWSSSDTAVLTVNDTGLVTPVAVGKATITATSEADATKSASVEITVTEPVVEYTAISAVTAGITATVKGKVVATNLKSFIIHDGTAGVMVYLNQAPEVKIGNIVEVSGSVVESKYANGLPQFDNKASIKVLESGDITVPAAAELTAAKLNEWKGKLPATEDEYSKQFLQTTDIQAYKWRTTVGEDGGYKTFNLDGSNVKIQHIYLDEAAFPVTNGTTYDVEGYFGGYNYHDYAGFVFTKIEKVVSDVAPTSLTLEKGVKGKLFAGTTVKINVAALPAGANDEVTWGSSNAEVATVADGVVSLLKEGTVVITATSTADQTVSGSLELTVLAALENDGSNAEKAFTGDEFIDYVDSSAFDGTKDVYVTGTITSASYFEKDETKNWTIDIAAEKGVVEFFRANDTDNLADFKADASSLVGYTVVAHGKGTYYASGKKYELNAGCTIDSLTPGEEKPMEVDLSKEGTVMTVAEVKASEADDTKLVRVTGVAENNYGNAKYGNFYLVDPATGDAIVIYGGYTSGVTYTKIAGKYSSTLVNQVAITAEGVIGKVVTVVGALGNHNGVGQVVNGLVTVNTGDAPKVHSVSVADGIENGTVELSKTTDVAYGEEITVNATPSDGYRLGKLTVTNAAGTETDITEAKKFKATVKNVVSATFVSDSAETDKDVKFVVADAKPSKYTNSYVDEFTAAAEDGTVFTFSAINDGQETSKWTSWRFGRKSYDSAPFIKSNTAISDEIASVDLDLTTYSSNGVKSAKLLISTDGTAWTEAVDFTVSLTKGRVNIPLGNKSAPNLYYNIAFDLGSTGNNGSIQFSGFAFNPAL